MFDYTSVTPESIREDMEAVIATADAMVDRIVSESDPRTFANTVQPIETLGAAMGDAYGRGPFLGNAAVDEDVRNAARAAEERQAKWHVDLITRDDLYEAIRSYADDSASSNLEPEPRRFLDFLLRDFEMAGHGLESEARARLKVINTRLVEIGIQFARNLAEYEDFLVVTSADLEGLPPSYEGQLKQGEKQGTFLISMEYPDVVPFMENAKRRDLRQALSARFNSRAVQENRPLLEEAVELRAETARLFEVDSWAHYRMQEKMAKQPERVEEFYSSLIPPLQAKARNEMDELSRLLANDAEGTEFQAWDWRYYHTQVKRTDYGLDPMEVASYFPLEQVVGGMLSLTAEVFGLTYHEIAETNAWHDDVRLYEIRDTATGAHVAHFYMDLFPRDGKFGHAAAWPLVHARSSDGQAVRPVSAILANFTKPTAERPSLLQHTEVVTLFHEFGHILHMSLADTLFSRFSGASTEWDFVEAPSQIMEHWCYKPAVLQRFAKHYESGNPIPAELVQQLEAARNLHVGISTMRQISFGVLDMGMHGPKHLSLDEALAEATAVSLFPFQEGTFFPASFGHMFGYDAGYYGYLWSEVFGDDMFSMFEESGVTDPGIGMRYRKEILEPNGSRDADDLLLAFLGRAPSNRAFLAKLGIDANDL